MNTTHAQMNWDSTLQSVLPELWIDTRTSATDITPAAHAALRQYGFALVRGLGSDPSGRDAVAPALNRFGAMLGTIVRQNKAGSLLEDIRDFSDTDAFDNRGYRSPGELSLHTDPPTLIALHCLAPARSGGENQLVNIEALYDHMAAQRPDLLPSLLRGYRYWIPSEKYPGAGEPSNWARPILAQRDGRTSCVYYRPYIEAAASAAQEPLSALDVEAMDYFDALASASQFQIRLTLAPGDTLVLHNRAVMHARGAYEDWPESHRRRHLLRLWIDAPDIRPAQAEHELGDFFAQR
jgi:alpha-ketoglutarate-dependent taurine dioxygenase